MTTATAQTGIDRVRKGLFSAILLIVSVFICLALAEAALRIKNSSMTNYDIEMWRYSKDLKQLSPDPALDFDHLKSKSAVLENVNISLNSWGLRGPEPVPVPPGGRRILFLGGSITLGWGVEEDKTVEARLEKDLNAAGEHVQVLNGGVGNYNAERYISRFFKELEGLKPTDIVVNYFLRDAESLPSGGGNFLLEHSELAVTLWIAYHRLFDTNGEQSLVDHYRAVYKPTAPGFLTAQRELKELADYAKANNIRLYFAMIPDDHDLINYQFGDIHDMMHKIAEGDGYRVVDTLATLKGNTPEALWVLPGDPHPNALGHELMAKAILPVLAKTEP